MLFIYYFLDLIIAIEVTDDWLSFIYYYSVKVNDFIFVSWSNFFNALLSFFIHIYFIISTIKFIECQYNKYSMIFFISYNSYMLIILIFYHFKFKKRRIMLSTRNKSTSSQSSCLNSTRKISISSTLKNIFNFIDGIHKN